MTTKTLHGFTLWAVPRFHRPDVTPLPPSTKPDWTEKFYGYPTAPEEKPAADDKPAKLETCH